MDKVTKENTLQELRTLDDISVDGQRVLVRVDFNVPVGDDNEVDKYEDYRIVSALATIQELQQRRCRVVLLTHYESKTNPINSLEPIRRRLSDLLKEDVKLLNSLYGDEVETVVTAMEPGQVILLPNVRSDEREKSNNRRFAELISEPFDAYVSEAFSVAHRPHASVSVMPTLLPSAAGRRTVQEVKVMEYLREGAEHPYVAIVSGSKVTTKVGMIRTLLAQVDTLCIGGQIANVFLVAQGKYNTELYDDNEVMAAKAILDDHGDKLLLPTDVVIGPADGNEAGVQNISVDVIPYEVEGLWDIGKESVENILTACRSAKTVMWNGPVGRFEVTPYDAATKNLANGLAEIEPYRVIGGGETVSALETYNLVNKYDHVSVGGGSMIAFLEGKRMPGLDNLYK